MTTQTADNLNPKHFPMLRIAKLRGLTARRIGENVFAVPSHTRKADGIQWVVTFTADGAVTCSCLASKLPYCSHRAAAVNHHFTEGADALAYAEYAKALIEDRYQLRLRIRAGELTRDDRVYLAYCVKFYEAKRAAVMAAPAGIRRVESRGKVREYAGSYQI